MAMRNERNILNPEKLIEWGIKGVYNEYGLSRTFCSCGNVMEGKKFVCTKCGNTDFTPTKDYAGNITSKVVDGLVPGKDSSGHFTLSAQEKWLTIHKDSKNPADVLVEERDYDKPAFVEGSNIPSYGLARVEPNVLLEELQKNRNKLSNDGRCGLDVVVACEMGPEFINRYIGLVEARGGDNARWVVANLMKSKEYNFLRYALDNYRGDWSNEKEMYSNLGFNDAIIPYRNEAQVINSVRSCRYNRRQAVSEFNDRWKKLPIGIQNVLLSQFRSGLIDGDQFNNLALINSDLMNICPEAQEKILKKYFANFSKDGNYYRWRSSGDTFKLSDMVQYYLDHEIPITASTFELRGWRAMVNEAEIVKSGFAAKDVQPLVENMDTNPLKSIIEMGNLRRPRGWKKTAENS